MDILDEILKTYELDPRKNNEEISIILNRKVNEEIKIIKNKTIQPTDRC